MKLRVGGMVLVGKERLVGRIESLEPTSFTVRSAVGPVKYPRRTRVAPLVSRPVASRLLATLMTPLEIEQLPPKLGGDDFASRSTRFAALPLDVQVLFVRYLLYAADWLDRPTAEIVRRGVQQVWSHLAGALGVSTRAIRRAVFRRSPAALRQRGPAALRGFEYVGAFTLGAQAVVADRCYVAETRRNLALRVRTRPGTWHAWIRPDAEMPVANLALVAAHADSLDTLRLDGRRLGSVGVDAGCVAIVDGERLRSDLLFLARVRSSGVHWEDEIVERSGCFAETHMGDGEFDVSAHRVGGSAVMLRVNLTEDPDFDPVNGAAPVVEF